MKKRRVAHIVEAIAQRQLKCPVEIFFLDESHFTNEPYVQRGWFRKGKQTKMPQPVTRQSLMKVTTTPFACDPCMIRTFVLMSFYCFLRKTCVTPFTGHNFFRTYIIVPCQLALTQNHATILTYNRYWRIFAHRFA
jgi:hypothetical protein